MYDSILVPIDGRVPARVAADRAIDLADRFDAALSVLHVVESAWVFASDSLPDDPGREALDDRTDEDVDCRTIVESGTAHEATIHALSVVDAPSLDATDAAPRTGRGPLSWRPSGVGAGERRERTRRRNATQSVGRSVEPPRADGHATDR